MEGSGRREVNLAAVLDNQPFGRTQISVLILVVAAMFVDGYDIFMLGKIAPAVAEGVGVKPAAMTIVFLLQQIGLTIGSFVVSPLADRFGRKRALVWSLLIFGLITLATSLAHNIVQIAVLRGLAGISLAGTVPMGAALISEFAPRRLRSTVIGVAMVGYSAGNAAGAGAAFLIPVYGWQAAFWVGGALPLLLTPLMAVFLVDSAVAQPRRTGAGSDLKRLVRRIDPRLDLSGDERFVLPERLPRERSGVFEIFRGGRARATTIIWICCFFSMGNIALLYAWLPSFFREMAGVSLQRFAVVAAIGFFGGVMGTLSVGRLMDWFGAGRLIPLFYGALAVSIFAIGQVPFDSPFFVLVLVVWSFFSAGGQSGLNMLMAQIYPPEMKSTGIGWAGGIGRIGGIVAPLLGGAALTYNWSLPMTMTTISIPPLIVAMLFLFMRGTPQAVADVARPAGLH